MAESKKITQKDVYEKDLFADLTKSGKKAEKQLDADLKAVEDLSKGLKILLKDQEAILKQSKKGVVDSKKLNEGAEAIDKTVGAIKGLDAVEKERLKLLDKLKVANSDRIQKNVELKVQLERQNKVNKELAKEKVGLLNAYDKESKRLIKLRKNYKNLAVQNKSNTKESKKLLLEIKALDKKLKDVDASVGQFQRSVGDYSQEALGSTKATLALGAAVVGLNGDMGDLKKGFSANEEGSKELTKLTAQASAVMSTFANRAGKAGTELLGFFKEVAKGDKSLFDFSETAVNVADSFNGVIDASLNAADAAAVASDETFALDRQLLALNESLAILNGEFEKQQAIAGDSTRSFNEIQAAAEAAERANIKRLAIQEDIAGRELKIIEDRLKATEDDANRLALETEASEKRIALQEIQNELNVASIENQKVLGEVQRDRFERELDFAIDAFDTQKTINERQIGDDRKTLGERADIFNETVRLADSSFKSQKELFKEFVSDKIDFDELVAETDEAAIRRTLRQLDLDDIELGRALEVIKERKIAIQDLDDAEREITEAHLERVQAIADADQSAQQDTLELQAELLENELENEKLSKGKRDELNEALFDVKKSAIEDQANFEKQQARLTIKDADVLAARLREIETVKNNDIVRLNEDKNKAIAEQEKEAEAELLEFKKNLANQSIDATKAEIEKKNNAINEQLDDEISNREDAVSTQQQRAEQGLENTLAFEQQKLAEAEKAKLEQAKKEERQKRAILLSEAFLKAYIAELGQPDADSLKAGFKAASGVLIADGLGKAIAGSAFDGIEDTGIAGDGDSKGGKLWMLHPHERVMDRANNDKTGGMSNDNLADLAFDFRNGNLIKSTDAQQVGYKIDNNGVELAIKGMKGDIVQAINDKPIQHVNVSDLGNLIETVYKNGSKITTTHKLRNRFK